MAVTLVVKEVAKVGTLEVSHPKGHERRRLKKKSRQPRFETDDYEVKVERGSLFVQACLPALH